MTDPGSDIFELALACYRTPLAHQNRMSLAAPLPRDMNRLLWLANGSSEMLESATRQTGTKADELRDAARFLVQQLCFARGASHYRVLGLEPDATAEQLKEHHRLLMRLFHPDRAGGGESWTDHFASRANEAWTVLSRAQPRAAYDAGRSSSPSWVVAPVAADSTVPLAADPIHAPRPRNTVFSRARSPAPRRGMPALVLGGFALAAVLGVWGVYETRPPVSMPAAPARPAPESESESESSSADPADRSAIAALLAAPDWQALGQRERQARQRASASHTAREELEQAHRERLAADAVLLDRIRAERTQLEERLRTEQLRAERTWSERLAAEQAKLERLKAEQLQAERARDERLAAEQAKLAQLKAEQAKAEQMAEALRAEREQLERSRLKRTEATPARQARPDPPTEQPSESRRGVAAPDAETLASEELSGLIKRYTDAYRRGDLDGLMSLFSADARGKGGVGRDRIRQDYDTLFGTHQVRRMQLRDVSWARNGGSASAVGRYEVWLQRRDNGDLIQLAGDIHFKVRKQDGWLSIVAIDYAWPEH
ncbi:MAG: DnaJ domain-containing protein [Candidatus Competibacter sp.]|nr:DnaJ domain-containing protein [Candidatus Competibacter sp.]MDG4585183.1 DnaJ domain-containing protein [Candidatus Competibacter sp.]